MKYKYSKIANINSDLKLKTNRRPNVSKKGYYERKEQQYNTQELGGKREGTSELVIEGNAVYEIDKDCISCLSNKKI